MSQFEVLPLTGRIRSANGRPSCCPYPCGRWNKDPGEQAKWAVVAGRRPAKMGSEWVFRRGGVSRLRNGKTHSDPIFAGLVSETDLADWFRQRLAT